MYEKLDGQLALDGLLAFPDYSKISGNVLYNSIMN
jgi:hypothetical protein